MTTRHELTVEDKIQLIRNNDGYHSLSFRKWSPKYHYCIRTAWNILTRKEEYLSDHESSQNEDTNREVKDDTSLRIDALTIDWFSSQRAKNIPISGSVLQGIAIQIAEDVESSSWSS